MPDREKVIKGLECCLVSYEDRLLYQCDDCPYRATEDERKVIDWRCHLEELRSDALELLKAQEPRIITNEDFNDADEWGFLPAWCETTDGRVYCECITERALHHGPCRYWTAMPTDEQRKAVKWGE